MSNPYAPDVVSPLYWWMGQVVDNDHWYPNGNPKIHKRDDVPGFGYRYKCRIFGRDLKTKEHVSDDQLDWVDVILPPTAGSGHAGSAETPNIRQGSYVFGFYMDGILATRPVILGVLPNHSQTTLFGGDPSENFVPRSGFKGSDTIVPSANITTDPPSGTSPPTHEHPDPGGDTIARKDQQADGARCHYVPKTIACEGSGGALRGTQLAIKNAIAAINRVKSEINSFTAAASDIKNQISGIVSDVSNFIASLIKTLIGKIRGYVINKLNAGIKDLVNLIPPNLRGPLQKGVSKGKETLECVFNKIIAGLVALIQKLLQQIIDKFINAPMCAVENFIGSILSSILGEITGAIEGVLASIEGIIGKISGIAGNIMSALDIALGILNFLSCDEPSDCTMGDAWSFWGGAKCALENARSDFGKKLDGIISGIAGSETAPPCNTAAIPCGPPSVSITGGVGSGALGNPIIGVTGSILAIDFKSGGQYFSPPNINIIDSCGIGGGAVVVPIMSGSRTGIGSTTRSGIGSTTGAGTGAGTGSTTDTGGIVGTGTGTGGIVGTGTGNINLLEEIGPDGIPMFDPDGIPVFGPGGIPRSRRNRNRIIAPNENPLIGPDGNPVFGPDNRRVDVARTGGVGVNTGGIRTGITTFPIPNIGINTGPGISTVPNIVGFNTRNRVGIITFPNIGINTGPGISTVPSGTGINTGNNAGITTFPNIGINTGPGISTVPSGTEPTTGIGQSIIGAVILDSGTGYLQTPNGDLGGNGTVWAPRCSTIVQRSDGSYDTPYPPGKVITLNVGDTIQYPGELPVMVDTLQSVTSPECQDVPSNKITDPTRSDGSYPVVLKLSDVVITNPGVGYSSTDEITISPDYGTVLRPKYDTQGRLVDVFIISAGMGFVDHPKIEINSRRGINAQIVPVFEVIRIGDLPEDQDIVPPGTNIINVVDCVGRII